MNIFRLLSMPVLLLILIYSCKKDKDDKPVPTPTPQHSAILCTGNHAETYYPLAIDNKWTFPTFFSSFYDYVIRRTVSYNSTTYFEIINTQGYLDLYLRTDPNGDIIMYDESSASEFLFIPASPTNGQLWNFTSSSTRSVIDISASVTTTFCTYNDCLLIQTFHSNGDPNTKYYYKKGIGLVSYTTLGLGGVTFHLRDLVLN